MPYAVHSAVTESGESDLVKTPLRLGISRCLLDEPVRFDGGHKRDTFLVDVLGRHIEWVPICPEVEIGLGTPRESLRLAGSSLHPRLIIINTGRDHTRAMESFSKRKVR